MTDNTELSSPDENTQTSVAAPIDGPLEGEELSAARCRCERSKEKGCSLCRDCYLALPGHLRAGLRKRLGHGYAEAYRAACEWLDQEG